MRTMRFDILTIFPKIFDSYFRESILKRAQKKGFISIAIHNIRDFATGRHRKVDDSPYGGGPGMVMAFPPIASAVEAIKLKSKKENLKMKTRTILFSTRGKIFTNKDAKRLSKYDQLILICGRYEGVDERVAKFIADEEISIGDFVLSGGELPATIVVEVVSRHIQGVLGKEGSLEEIKGSYPVYTRPENITVRNGRRRIKNLRVPRVLVSGDHKAIAAWRLRFGRQQI